MKKIIATLLAGFMLCSGAAVLSAPAEEREYPFKISPTVEMREDGEAYSIKERPIKEGDYKIQTLTKHTKIAGKNGDENIFPDGGFENATETFLTGWSGNGVEGGVIGETNAFIVDDTAEGKKALKLSGPEGKNVHGVQVFTNMIPGEEYELSAWCKRVSGTANISLGFGYVEPETDMSLEYGNRVNLSFADAPANTWTQKIIQFTMPEDANKVTLMARLMGGGEIYYDGITILGPQKPVEVAAMPEYVKPSEGTENVFKNGGFEEETEVTHIKHGTEYEGVWFDRDDDVMKGHFTYSDAEAHSGKQSIHLKGDNLNMPWLGQVIKVEPETTYQISAWVKVVDPRNVNFRFQGDGYKNSPEQTAENYISDARTTVHPGIDPKNPEWQQIVGNFTTHQDAEYYCFMLRGGDKIQDMYFDDIELYPLAGLSKKLRSFIPDDVFYYSDYEGNGYADITTYKSTTDENQKVRFRFYDEEKVVKEEIVTLPEEGKYRFHYPLELLAEKKKEYRLEAMMLGANGEETDDFMERFIYKYDRPTMLNEALELMTSDGTKIENYILAQGTTPAVMWQIPEVGATIGRAIGTWRTDRIERLDVAYEAGMYATVTLFNHEDIRDPEVYADVVNTINMVKDHPALIGWYLWEEPKFAESTYDLQENIRIGAKLIRDLDPKHPLFGVVSQPLHAGELGKFCDILDMDIYPAQTYDGQRGMRIAEAISMGLESNDWQKVVSIMTQAFEWFEFQPTWNDLRNYIYMAMFEGAGGFSFHTFDKVGGIAENGTGVQPGDERWNGMVKASEWEYDFIFDHFVNQKAPLFNEGRTEDVWWRTVVRDGELYVIAVNTWENKESTVNIPLVDYTGKIKISGAKAELVEGGEAKTVNISGDTFPVDLEKFQSAVFKITPNEAVDFSGVKGTRFRDLQHHVWAREAIIEMDDKGIVNDLSAVAFAPGRNITRGDFAMFLVRALGLTGSGAKVSFDDVYTNREYAEAIAIGKEAGILNGVGDNKFNPDAEISRQDMMTIISRGMALSGDSDLSAFSDSSEIADYALSHVKAMIASGFIKGNADSTLNPLGQTTRAEAAVIMQRIINR